MKITRRKFIKISAAISALSDKDLSIKLLQPSIDNVNPLKSYPAREWEKIYRDRYKIDSSFTFVCSPNDTHACRLRAFLRNGIVVRIEQNYDVAKYADLFGNKASANWNPRGCLKGYTLHRRIYGPYRLKYPIVRKGWKEWADAGFPELTKENKQKYKFDARGKDKFLKLSWEETFYYIAKGFIEIAKRYSGNEGAKLLRAQGYEPEMISEMKGAGTRTCKFRGGMGLLGVIGKYGMYRLANSFALLDVNIRGVKRSEALAGRAWSNYTWHGDQAPGQPFVHGLQASESDLNDIRFSRLIIMAGKNLVENKMPESHWFVETMERGGKIVIITPEYGPPATKADYWIPVRPGISDTSLFLGLSKYLIDSKLYDEDFVKKFTDFPLLVRTDTLRRLKAHDVFPGYKPGLQPDGASFKMQGLTEDQYGRLGDFVIYDLNTKKLKAITRDDVGSHMEDNGLNPSLFYREKIKLADGRMTEIMSLWEMYKIHLKDYDIDTVSEITHAPKELIIRLAKDIASIKPVSIHTGEGINHWFHATLHNRATYLPLMLTGNIGLPGSGSHTWAGNYKSALFQGSVLSGPGLKAWVSEDPFEPNLNPDANGKTLKIHSYTKDEEPAYWNHGDRPLIVDTPKMGRKVFTGKTHMPTPTKALFFSNVNHFNNSKHSYEVLKNVNSNIEMIISADIEMTSSIEYSDFGLPANSWMEFEDLEITASCSNPFFQIWKGGINPLYDSKDDAVILAKISEKIGELTGDRRFADYWKFVLEGNSKAYIQRLLDSSATTSGYNLDDIITGKYGEEGAALMLFRTYPRNPFYEQIKDSLPFYTDTGRLNSYCDIPEAIEYGENFVVHREGPEATPYLPNVIVSSNPYIKPEDYGISPDAMHWDLRTVRNIKMPWTEVKETVNPLWKEGYRFYCITPKSRHSVHSQWSITDWNEIWASNFGDPYRVDKRTPGAGEHQLHINPVAAQDLGINDGDYVYVDANPMDRPYIGWKADDPFYKVSHLMLRVKYNPSYPYDVLMMKHGAFIATERSVKAHETRNDGRALSEETGYQSNFRYGSHQSLTRNWHMPMHQTDTLFHKAKNFMGFIFGGEADNHAINTVPKETLVKIIKAEDGGMEGKGVWAPAKSGWTPANESGFMKKYLNGEAIKIKKL